jgi:hypothetical protein
MSLVVSHCGSDGVNVCRVQVSALIAMPMQQTSVTTDFSVVSGGVIGEEYEGSSCEEYGLCRAGSYETSSSIREHLSLDLTQRYFPTD